MNERIAELEARVAELREALEAASEHLDYCGYGDSWENECAEASGLPEKIASALSRPDDFSTLNEAKAKVLEEMSLECSESIDGSDVRDDALNEKLYFMVQQLDRRAQEIREGK